MKRRRGLRWSLVAAFLLIYPAVAYRGFDAAADHILWVLQGRPGSAETFIGEPLPAPDAARPLVASAAAAPEPGSPPAGAEVYVFPLPADPSTIEWRAARVTRSHVGHLILFEGQIHAVDGDPTASRVNVQFQMNSILGDMASLTMHLHTGSFFNVAQFPTGGFTSTRIERTTTGYDVTGNLTLRDVTRSITFPATIEMAGDRITADAEFFIDRQDWDVAFPGFGDDIIRDEVLLRLHIEAAPASAPAATAAA